MQWPFSQAAPLWSSSSSSMMALTNKGDAARRRRRDPIIPQSEGLQFDAAVDDSGETNAPSNHQETLIFGDDAPLPVFTSRQEEIEFASQPAEEIVAAEADVLGLTQGMAAAHLKDDVNHALVQLEAEVALLPDTAKAAYIKATIRCPEQVVEEHKRAFLMREEYDVKLAAKRLAKYWEHRLLLFGEEKCYLPFTLGGALKEDTIALQHCIFYILPNKDEKGRSIMVWKFDNYDDMALCSEESMLRACWYTFHAASRDTMAQERGFVMLFQPTMSLADKHSANWQLLLMHLKLARGVLMMEANCLPVNIRGFHWCKPARNFHLVNPIVKYMLGKRLRGRFKVHYGTDEEVLKSLEEYGMPRKRLPTEFGGDVKFCHERWLADRLAEEAGTYSFPAAASAAAESPGVVQPSPPDLIEVNSQLWEPNRIRTKDASVFDDQERHLTAAVQFSREAVSRYDDLELASSVTRKAYRHKHTCEEGNSVAESNSVTRKAYRQKHTFEEDNSVEVSNIALGANERPIADDATLSNDAKNRKTKAGRKGDPRMNKAVKAKLENPALSAEDALHAGGFVFPIVVRSLKNGIVDLVDNENVSLKQRKNQLQRRIRSEMKKANVTA